MPALLSEQFLKSETYVSDDDFHARRYEKGEVEAEFITVDGSKLVEPIGERQSEFLGRRKSMSSTDLRISGRSPFARSITSC